MIYVALLVLSGLIVSVCLLFGRELRRRAEIAAELEHPSLTDAPTAPSDRLRIAEALSGTSAAIQGSRRASSLPSGDVDHVDRIEHRHGHAGCDKVLKGIARSLATSAHLSQEVVYCVGG